MKRFLPLAVFTAAFGFFAVGDSCRAAVVFDNGDHLGSGIQSSIGYENADDFSFANPTTITDVHWKGVYGNGVAAATPDDFTIRIYADDGSGNPTAPVMTSAIYTAPAGAANRALSGDPAIFGVYTVYSYSAFIPPFAALGGTNYWLSIYNNANNDYWFWTFDYDAGNASGGNQGSNWTRNFSYALTFQLTNDAIAPVPESASFIVWSVVIGLGLVASRVLRGQLATTRSAE